MLVKSKVGPQLNITGNQDATQWLLRGQPTVGLGIHAGVPGEYTRDIVWVYRIYENDFQPANPQAGGYSQDPVQAARQYAIKWYGPVLTKDNSIRYLTTPNEPVVQDAATMIWFSAFLVELTKIITVDYGRKAVVGNWSVGAPDFGLWLNYKPVLEAVTRYGGFLGRHSYGPLNEFYALRHRSDNGVFASLGFPDLPVILTEAGWENLSEVPMRAWKNPPYRTAQEYVDYLLQLDAELWRDAYCVGACVFTYGLSWFQHNLNDSGVGSLFGSTVQVRQPFDFFIPTAPQKPTNQQVFNAVAKIGGASGVGRMPHDLVRSMLANRNAVYTGPNPEAWGLTENEKTSVAKELRLS